MNLLGTYLKELHEIRSTGMAAPKTSYYGLTREEWRRYMGDDVPYRKTCPDLPQAIFSPKERPETQKTLGD